MTERDRILNTLSAEELLLLRLQDPSFVRARSFGFRRKMRSALQEWRANGEERPRGLASRALARALAREALLLARRKQQRQERKKLAKEESASLEVVPDPLETR